MVQSSKVIPFQSNQSMRKDDKPTTTILALPQQQGSQQRSTLMRPTSNTIDIEPLIDEPLIDEPLIDEIDPYTIPFTINEAACLNLQAIHLPFYLKGYSLLQGTITSKFNSSSAPSAHLGNSILFIPTPYRLGVLSS